MKTNILDEAFNLDEEEGTPPLTLLPAGKYKAEITSAKQGITKNEKGQAVYLTWTITEGEFENCLLFQQVLLRRESADAERIGRQKFFDVVSACGYKTGEFAELDLLLYKPCEIYVGIRKDKDGQYPDKNEVKRVSPIVASWNGSKLAVDLPKASTTPNGLGAVDNKELNDEIPF